MPLLIVAGVSQPLVIRNKAFRVQVPGWDVHLIHSRSNKSDLWTCWEDVLHDADTAHETGVHIFAFHYVEDERRDFDQIIYARHRLTWLDRETLQLYGQPAFTNTLKDLVCFEEDWRGKVRPQDYNSPLILPEHTFTPAVEYQDIWSRTQRVRVGRDDLDGLAGLIKRFKNHHYSSGVWHDTRGLLFDSGGARHGLHIDPGKRWKFTYMVPSAFHYDVKHSRAEQSFRILDYVGVEYRFDVYTNVDCHGYIRGGQ